MSVDGGLVCATSDSSAVARSTPSNVVEWVLNSNTTAVDYFFVKTFDDAPWPSTFTESVSKSLQLCIIWWRDYYRCFLYIRQFLFLFCFLHSINESVHKEHKNHKKRKKTYYYYYYYLYGMVNCLHIKLLQESYSLPVLVYSKQIRELRICWNSVIRKLFNYNK